MNPDADEPDDADLEAPDDWLAAFLRAVAELGDARNQAPHLED